MARGTLGEGDRDSCDRLSLSPSSPGSLLTNSIMAQVSCVPAMGTRAMGTVSKSSRAGGDGAAFGVSVSAFPFHVQLYALSVSSWCPLRVRSPVFSLTPECPEPAGASLGICKPAAPNPELPKLEPEQEQLSWSCEANALLASLIFIFPAVSCA